MSFIARPLAAAVAVFAAMVMIGAGPTMAETVIRIGTPDQSLGPTPTGGVSLVTYVAANKLLEQEFAKDGIKIEWTYFKGAGPAVNEALANRQLDFAYLGDLAHIIGRSNGLKTRFVLPVRGLNSYLATPSGSDIKTIADLKGKRLTVLRGTTFQLTLDRALASAGLSERDVQIVNLDWSAASAAIAARQIDADWVGPQALTLKEKGLADIPVSSITLGPQYTYLAGFMATEEFIDAHPDVTQRLVNVLVSAERDLTDPAKFRQFLVQTAKVSEISLPVAEAEYQGADLRFRFSPRLDPFVAASFQASIDQAKALGLIRKPFVAADWIEPKYVDAAIAAQGLKDVWPAYDKDGKPVAEGAPK
jgi:sulfonate transport system substrate-binding protein